MVHWLNRLKIIPCTTGQKQGMNVLGPLAKEAEKEFLWSTVREKKRRKLCMGHAYCRTIRMFLRAGSHIICGIKDTSSAFRNVEITVILVVCTSPWILMTSSLSGVRVNPRWRSTVVSCEMLTWWTEPAIEERARLRLRGLSRRGCAHAHASAQR